LLGGEALGFGLLGFGLLGGEALGFGLLGFGLLGGEALGLADALRFLAVSLLDRDDRQDELRRVLDAQQLGLDQPAHHLAGLEKRESALAGQLGHRPFTVDLAQQGPLVRAELDRLRRGLSRGQHGHC
jgi:hypothetical protein